MIGRMLFCLLDEGKGRAFFGGAKQNSFTFRLGARLGTDLLVTTGVAHPSSSLLATLVGWLTFIAWCRSVLVATGTSHRPTGCIHRKGWLPFVYVQRVHIHTESTVLPSAGCAKVCFVLCGLSTVLSWYNYFCYYPAVRWSGF